MNAKWGYATSKQIFFFFGEKQNTHKTVTAQHMRTHAPLLGLCDARHPSVPLPVVVRAQQQRLGAKGGVRHAEARRQGFCGPRLGDLHVHAIQGHHAFGVEVHLSLQPRKGRPAIENACTIYGGRGAD